MSFHRKKERNEEREKERKRDLPHTAHNWIRFPITQEEHTSLFQVPCNGPIFLSSEGRQCGGHRWEVPRPSPPQLVAGS